jgi:hypothetical protein
MPVALPPPGTYRVTVEAAADRVDGGPLATAEVSSDGVRLTGSQPGERLRVVFVEAAAG